MFSEVLWQHGFQARAVLLNLRFTTFFLHFGPIKKLQILLFIRCEI